MMEAKWVVLFPGAAQQSMTLLPGGGAKRNATKHEACKVKLHFIVPLFHVQRHLETHCTGLHTRVRILNWQKNAQHKNVQKCMTEFGHK